MTIFDHNCKSRNLVHFNYFKVWHCCTLWTQDRRSLCTQASAFPINGSWGKIYLWCSRQQWQHRSDMKWTLFLVRNWHIDQFSACDWSLCTLPVFLLVNTQSSLQALCHISRISQNFNWENGILTIHWAGFKLH